MLSISASTSSRLLKKAAHCVLSRPSPCDVPQGYASVAALPAALLSAFLSSLPGLMQLPLAYPAESLWIGGRDGESLRLIRCLFALMAV